MQIETGYFFITDITGYTRFLTQSELGHAKEILDAVFQGILDNLEPPFTVAKVEGDAIFCYVPNHLVKRPQGILESMGATYLEFRKQLKLMDINTTCDCNACANMTELDLKVFIHHGEYIMQEIAGGSELAGSDVILVHRMMKNTVKEAIGVSGYGMVTQDAIDATGISNATEGMTEHIEHLEDFGDVTTWIADLYQSWLEESLRSAIEVNPADAIADASIEIPISQWIAWSYLIDPEVRRQYLQVDSHERVDGDGSSLLVVGSQFHCAHGDQIIEYAIVDMDAPHYFTIRNEQGELTTLSTTRLAPTPDGVEVRNLISLEGDGPAPPPDAIQQSNAAGLEIFRNIIMSDLTSGAISQEQIEAAESGKTSYLRPDVAKGRFADLGSWSS